MTDVPTPESPEPRDPRKGPMSFLSGALTAGLMAWLALGLSRRMVVYFAKAERKVNLLLRFDFLIAEDDDVMAQPCRVDFGKSRVVEIAEIDITDLRPHRACERRCCDNVVVFRPRRDRIHSVHVP